MPANRYYKAASLATRIHLLALCATVLGLTSCHKDKTQNDPSPAPVVTPIPAADNNKVAYYTFDATPTGTPAVKLSMLDFAKTANIVVVFEGSAWELADTVHYGQPKSIMLSGYYKSYRSIIRDMHKLQARGVKVLLNVDDHGSWNTTTPFTTYDGTAQTYQQFAAFLDNCVSGVLQADGIALDVEHFNSVPNANFFDLLHEFGRYYGPKSAKPTTSLYTAAIYNGTPTGFAIGQSPAVASPMNFVMDMAYGAENTNRYNLWAQHIGAEKTMLGLVKDLNTQANGVAAARYQPASGRKAGIMVYAANVDSAYANTIMRAL